MILDLPDTTTTDVSKALVSLRHSVGAMAMGRVLTLLVLSDQGGADEAIQVANDATRQHPARIIVVVRADGAAEDRLDAQIRVGGDAGASEIVVLSLRGQLGDHGGSVVTPLLLPDSPIVGWWPGEPPEDVAGSALGKLAHRRITDAGGCREPYAQLAHRAMYYQPGDSDLAWTRITRWRALLAAALDYPPFEEVSAVTVAAEPDSPGADLLAGWLASSLRTPVRRARSRPGTGLVSVRLQRASGPVDLIRIDDQIASLSQPEQPTREVALLEPSLSEALAAELHRLDADEVYATSLCDGLSRVEGETVTQGEAIRRGLAPATPATSHDSSEPAVSSTALHEREPDQGSPAPEVLERAVEAALEDLPDGSVTTRVLEDPEKVARAVAEAAIERLSQAVQMRGAAHLVLTGGSMGSATVRALAELAPGAELWRSVHVWWGDERFVPSGDAERNDRQAQDAGLGALGVPGQQMHPAPAGSDVEALPRAAADYATQLAAWALPMQDENPNAVAVPAFDVLLLGVGPDGHVASLFPHRPELSVDDASTVPVTESPKPPPLRVSLTFPALLQARATWLVVCGEDKAEAVARSVGARDDPAYPASWARGSEETLWWLDEAAASHLEV